MKTKTCTLLFFIVCCFVLPFGAARKWKDRRTVFKEKEADDNVMDVTDFSIYYDLGTNETIRKMMPRPWYKPGWLLRLPFMGGRCDCGDLQCTCCTGIRIQAFNFDRRTCAILKYEPKESMIDLEVMMNNETVFRSSYSARNPPPFCLPVPVPYLPPGLVDMCVRLFDISVADQKLHVCMDMDTRLDKAPVLVLHFDCMDMSSGGIGLSKPSGSGSDTNLSPAPAEVTNNSTTEPIQLDYDVYDPVTEKIETTESPFTNSVKYI